VLPYISAQRRAGRKAKDRATSQSSVERHSVS
jgi:hypothetical protein